VFLGPSEKTSFFIVVGKNFQSQGEFARMYCPEVDFKNPKTTQ